MDPRTRPATAPHSDTCPCSAATQAAATPPRVSTPSAAKLPWQRAPAPVVDNHGSWPRARGPLQLALNPCQEPSAYARIRTRKRDRIRTRKRTHTHAQTRPQPGSWGASSSLPVKREATELQRGRSLLQTASRELYARYSRTTPRMTRKHVTCVFVAAQRTAADDAFVIVPRCSDIDARRVLFVAPGGGRTGACPL